MLNSNEKIYFGKKIHAQETLKFKRKEKKLLGIYEENLLCRDTNAFPIITCLQGVS
jgi:hypothetical protein